MNIIIIGCGKVGYTIAKNLSVEDNSYVTIVDNKQECFEKISDSIDAMFVKGNGMSVKTLIEAGVKDADLVISVTSSDEANILCSISAKRLGAGRTIARVRDPEYALDLNKLWRELGLDLIINPEQHTAREISRLLRFPAADDIDTFIDGRVELAAFNVSEAYEFFEKKSVKEVFNKKNMNVLLAVIERNDEAIIPRGDLIFQNGDIIRIIGRPSDIMNFFALIGKNTEKVKNAVIIGGGKITHYLVTLLSRHSGSTGIKIIEKDRKKCEELSETFQRCLIINSDGTDENILHSEILGQTEAVICLTDRDEENTIIALYSLQFKIRKVILKINHINKTMVKNLGLGSLVCPMDITSEQIIRYVRGLANASGGDIATAYKIFENDYDKVEAIEININPNPNKKHRCLDIQLSKLKLKPGILIGCIVRNSNIIIPSGESVIQNGDKVIIISKNEDILNLNDILS